MRVIETKAYKFNELDDSAKEKAREWWREKGLDYEWWDSVYDDYHEKITSAGFGVGKMYFSGFWSQGDGAMFEYDSLNDKLLRDFADTLNLTPMRKQWLVTQGYISGSGRQSGHYHHEKSCSHNVTIESNFQSSDAETFADWICEFQMDFEEFIEEKYVDLASDLYKSLEKEYDWLMSDEHVDETIGINHYEFTKEGEII